MSMLLKFIWVVTIIDSIDESIEEETIERFACAFTGKPLLGKLFKLRVRGDYLLTKQEASNLIENGETEIINGDVYLSKIHFRDEMEV